MVQFCEDSANAKDQENRPGTASERTTTRASVEELAPANEAGAQTREASRRETSQNKEQGARIRRAQASFVLHFRSFVVHALSGGLLPDQIEDGAGREGSAFWETVIDANNLGICCRLQRQVVLGRQDIAPGGERVRSERRCARRGRHVV